MNLKKILFQKTFGFWIRVSGIALGAVFFSQAFADSWSQLQKKIFWALPEENYCPPPPPSPGPASSFAPRHYAIHLQDAHPIYRHLREIYNRLAKIFPAKGNHYPQNFSKNLKDRATIFRHLWFLGYMPWCQELNAISPDDGRQALKIFQIIHNISPTGNLDDETLDLLNIPVSRIFYHLEKELQTEKYFPLSKEHHLLVNLPSFQIYGFYQQQIIFSSLVVIGKISNETPVLQNLIQSCQTSPIWIVPKSLQKDLMKQVGKGLYFMENGMLKRKASSNGPLGCIKFPFSSSSVLLHSTNEPAAFSKSVRALSSGCIRLQDHLQLLNFIFHKASKSQLQTQSSIFQALEKKITQTFSLPKLPIITLYFTLMPVSKEMFPGKHFSSKAIPFDRHYYLQILPDIYSFYQRETLPKLHAWARVQPNEDPDDPEET